MTEEEIRFNLCVRDPRHPEYEDLKDAITMFGDDMPEPRENCACNNCFCGRDELAVELLRKLQYEHQNS